MNHKNKNLILIFLILGFLFFSQPIYAETITKTLYAWARDLAGNISLSLNDTVDITLPSDPANTYYVSFSTGNDGNNGTSSSTPWKTIAKVNSQTFTPGASILFKKGDTWTGETITVNSSGNSSAPITYSSYGQGSQPVISGFTTVTGWTNEGGGIYSKTIATQSAPNMVTINDTQYGMGRWPNTGTNLIVDSHITNTSITDADLNSSVTNWTGAEAVIRKNEFSLDRGLITSHTGQTLNYTNLSSQQEAQDGYYYFIQNDIRTLDQFGEWYYGSGKLYMYFGGQTPTNYTVKMSTVDKLFYVYWYPYITIDNLFFEGANSAAMYFKETDHTIVKNCNINFSGGDGIHMQTTYGLIDNTTINHINQEGIESLWAFTVITNNTITNVGLIEGAGLVGSYQNGINNSGPDTLIQYNHIESIGSNGIFFTGSRTLIKNNFINNFCLKMNDCGGIGTAEGIDVGQGSNASVGRVVEGNIVMNGIGTLGIASYDLYVIGIYLDAYSSNILVKDNTVANCPSRAMVLSNTHNNTLQDNTLYNNQSGLQFLEWGAGNSIYNIIMTGNIYISGDVPLNAAIEFQSNNGTIGDFGTANLNYYSRYPSDSGVIFTTEQGANWISRSLSNWQSYTGQDLNSTELIIPSPSDLFFDYNATKVNKVVSLVGTYKKVDGTPISGSITLLPYTSIILIKTN